MNKEEAFKKAKEIADCLNKPAIVIRDKWDEKYYAQCGEYNSLSEEYVGRVEPSN